MGTCLTTANPPRRVPPGTLGGGKVVSLTSPRFLPRVTMTTPGPPDDEPMATGDQR